VVAEAEYVVLGAGLSGLSVAHGLGGRALVLERDSEPGGLVRTRCIDGYWFDLAVHLLYFADAPTEAFVRTLPEVHLAKCPPEAFVETAAGVARYPIQSHLATLERSALERCLEDFRRAYESPLRATNFREFLLGSFGETLCELFFFPYNDKLWKRPLTALAPTGFQWNIDRPGLDAVLAGASGATHCTYNTSGFYPVPPRGSDLRGIHVLARALSKASTGRVECGVNVVAVDLEAKVVTAVKDGQLARYRYLNRLISTIPLPVFVGLCQPLPHSLRAACSELRHNRVRSVCVAVRGVRPTRTGHWRYYADPTVVFHRLVYPHVFDPDMAPDAGFGVLAEVTELGESTPQAAIDLGRRVTHDLFRVGALPPNSEVVGVVTLSLDPAYVVFGLGHDSTVTTTTRYLADRNVDLLGRYARWEYSSMAQVIRDGLMLSRSIIGRSAF
jgi:protoporphyrinogen oxidase